MVKTKTEMQLIAEKMKRRDEMFSAMLFGDIVSEEVETNPFAEDDSENSEEFIKREIDGALADAVRKRLDAPEGSEVFITERIATYALSEVTMETDHRHVLECNGFRKEFDHSIAVWNFEALLRWLDGEE